MKALTAPNWWATPHRSASLVVAQPKDNNRDISKRSWSNLPPGMATREEEARERRRLPSIGGIDVRLAHQLPRKPVAGAGASI